MPNCFQLSRKATGQAEELTIIDEEMCAHFKVPCHPTQWHSYWYDIIGLYLACGKDFDKIREDFRADRQKALDDSDLILAESYDHMIDIANWLDENFTANSWYQVGR